MPKRLKNAIPETDIEGVAFSCFKIAIPDTRLWKRTLFQAIYMMTRGAYWDESTGSILEVKQIAYDVLYGMQEVSCNDDNGGGDGGTDSQENQEIIKIIEKEFDMCCCNNCGCKSEGGYSNQQNYDAVKELPTVPSEVTAPTDAQYASRRCKLIHVMINRYLVWLANLPSVWDTALEEEPRINQLIEFTSDVLGAFNEEWAISFDGYMQAVRYLETDFTNDAAAAFRQWIIDNRERLVCVLIEGDTILQVRGNVMSFFLTAPSIPMMVRLAGIGFGMLWPYEMILLTGSEYIASPIYEEGEAITDTCDCAGSGSDESYSVPTSYKLLPFLPENGSATGDIVLDRTSNIYVFDAEKSATYTWDWVQPLDDGVPIPLNDVKGLIMEVLEVDTPDAANFGYVRANSSTHGIDSWGSVTVAGKLKVASKSGETELINWAAGEGDVDDTDESLQLFDTSYKSFSVRTGWITGDSLGRVNRLVVKLWAVVDA